MKPISKLELVGVASLVGLALEVGFFIGFCILFTSESQWLGIDQLRKLVLTAFVTFHAPAFLVARLCGVSASGGLGLAFAVPIGAAQFSALTGIVLWLWKRLRAPANEQR